MATTKVTQSLIADDAIGADQLASNAVVNASIASGASIDMDKLDGDSLGTAITDFAQDDLVILSDTSASGNLVKITTSNFEDAIFGNISGDVTLAAGGAATLASAQTNITSLLATDIKIGEDDQTKIDFETADTINFYAGSEKQLILTDGALTPGSNAIVDLGTDALEFKDAFFDGTVEADAYTVAGTALNEYIADTIGAMVGSNTETGIAVTYEDGDNTLDFVIGAGVIVNSMLADDAVGADELAANAVVNASIASGAAIDMDKLDGDSLATAITDFAQDDLVILSDTSDSGNLVKITTSNFEDAIFGNISGDATVAAGGALTIANDAVEQAMIADDAVGADQLAASAVVTASMVDDAVTAAKLASNAVVTASITDDNVTHAKLEGRYTAKATSTSTSGTISLDCSAATTFLMTGNVATATLRLDDMKLGQAVDIVLSGTLSSAAITLDTNFTSETIRKVGTTELDTSATNVITVVCIDDTTSAALVHYTINTFATDTTP